MEIPHNVCPLYASLQQKLIASHPNSSSIPAQWHEGIAANGECTCCALMLMAYLMFCCDDIQSFVDEFKRKTMPLIEDKNGLERSILNTVNENKDGNTLSC